MGPIGDVEDDSKLECFPIKLMEIINDEVNSDIITWTPEGNGFVILNKNRLAVDVLPKVFKMTQYTSFTRRLKRWGFIIGRTTHGSQTSSYHHPLFTRDDVSNVLKMRPLSRRHQYRKQVGNQAKQYGTDANQMHQSIPPCMIPIYNVPGLYPNYAVPMSYYDQLGLINLTSTIPSSRLPGLGNMNMMPNTQTTIPAYGNYSENFQNLPIMNLLSSRGSHRNLTHAEALHMMLNSNAEAMYANSHSNYTINDAQIQVPPVISQNGSLNSYQSDPSRGHEHSVNRDRSLYYSPNRFS
jgi:hypothetical protein